MRGIYLLILRLETELAALPIGRLGSFDFAPGYYLYVGSAFGSGGVEARVGYHARAEKARPHWHIDYLRARATLIEAWMVGTEVRAEACWARDLAARPEVSVPVPGFGASDSSSASHLLYTAQRPEATLLLSALNACLTQAQWRHLTLEIRLFSHE